MSALYLYEPPEPGLEWAPFAKARPIAELRAGAWRIRERWAMALGTEVTAVLSTQLAGFADADAAPVEPLRPISGPALIGVSWFAPFGTPVAPPRDARRLTHHGHSVGWIIPAGETWSGPTDQGPAVEVEGRIVTGAADLVTALEHLLVADCEAFLAEPGDGIPDGCVVLGDPRRVLSYGAEIEPTTVLDTRKGPIVLSQGVLVKAGARLEGPLFAGPRTVLIGGSIRYSAFGPECRIHGEMTNTVFLGYANKGHDGFVGHSVVGQWANFGAGTITSNLKNTYGEIRLDLPGNRLATGRTNLGALVGDHAKTAIGTLLSTGTVIGTGANVVGTPVPRYVHPFAWGALGSETLEQEGFLKMARRILPRRAVPVTPAIEASLVALYQRHARL